MSASNSLESPRTQNIAPYCKTPAGHVHTFAPAKINLDLHITGQYADGDFKGYHSLSSLVAFADIGDMIEIAPDTRFTFETRGEFASALEETAPENNLVVRAARALAEATNNPLTCKITLTKNLPLGAGIGGGSANAAATLRGLVGFWGLDKTFDTTDLNALALHLGADVPVCLKSKPVIMTGIGQNLKDAPALPKTYIILAKPPEHSSTPAVFQALNGRFSSPPTLPDEFENYDAMLSYLESGTNNLYAPAIELTPFIATVKEAVKKQAGCSLARMNGSGSSVFGLFESRKAAENSAFVLKLNHPDWWVKAASLI